METQWMTEVVQRATQLRDCLAIVQHEGYDAENAVAWGEITATMDVIEALLPRLKAIAKIHPGYLIK